MPHIDIRGVSLHYEDAGQGPVVLFVHGWAASWKFWRSAAALLAPRFRTISVDLAGFCGSAKPAGAAHYTIEAQAVRLRGLLDALEIPKVHLVGHSMGSMISAVFAVCFPHRLHSLTLVNGPVEGPTCLFPKSRLLVLPGVRRLMFTLARIRPIRRWVAKDFTHACPLPDELVDDIIDTTFESAFASLDSMIATNVAPRLAEIACPTLVVYTDRDLVIRARQSELARERVAGARSGYVADAGHCPMIERPAVFEKYLQNFLSSVPSVPPTAAASGTASAESSAATGGANRAEAVAAPRPR
ncbi:MAG: alpha/beta hydrolase [Planctomycetes bacterium]|nr:alpha/beta hydrolase [Planctomycetota bacterium]